MSQFIKGFLEILRDMLIAKVAKAPKNFLQLTDEDQSTLIALTEQLSAKDVQYFFSVVQNVQRSIKYSPFPKLDVETAMIKLVMREDLKSLSAIIEELAALKNDIGVPTQNNAAIPSRISSRQSTVKTDVISKKHVRKPLVENDEVPPLAVMEMDIESEIEVMPSNTMASEISKSASPGLSAVQKKWEHVLQLVKKESMSIGTYLSFGKPISLENKTLTIAFAPEHKLNREAFDSDVNKKIIEKHISNQVGIPIVVRIILANELEGADTAEQKTKPSAELEGIVKSAMDIFQGRVVKNR